MYTVYSKVFGECTEWLGLTKMGRSSPAASCFLSDRLTAQRSIEDAEETERERRRRAREAALTQAAGKGSWGALPGGVPQSENYSPASENNTLQYAPQCENSVPQSEDSVPQSEDPPPLNKDKA